MSQYLPMRRTACTLAPTQSRSSSWRSIGCRSARPLVSTARMRSPTSPGPNVRTTISTSGSSGMQTVGDARELLDAQGLAPPLPVDSRRAERAIAGGKLVDRRQRVAQGLAALVERRVYDLREGRFVD